MMRKKIVFFILAFVLLIPFGVMALEDGEVATISDDVSGKSFFQIDRSLNVTGIFNGSVFFAGDDVAVDASVDGITFTAGNMIDVKGDTKYAFVAGNSITYGAFVNDLFAAGNIVTIAEEAIISRDLYVAGSSVVLNSNIGRNAYISGNEVTINNVTINGNVSINASKIVLGDCAVINGTLNYNADAKISGLDVAAIKEVTTFVNANNVDVSRSISDKLLAVIGNLIVALVICVMAPALFEKIDLDDDKITFLSVVKKLAFGTITLMVVPIAVILLLVSVMGIQLGFVMSILYLLMFYFSSIFSSYVVGDVLYRKVFKKKSNSYISMFIGVILVSALLLVPYLGVVLSIIMTLYGFGIGIDLLFNRK